MDARRSLLSVVMATGLVAATSVVAVAQDEPAADPVGVIAIGHGGLLAQGTDPERRWQPALENSWATGTNPAVRSIYQRLVEVWPETEGHAANTAKGGASTQTLASQAWMALQQVPAPALVIIQSIDNDIRCDGTDATHVAEFGTQMAATLELITEASPRSRILVLGQLSDPAAEAEALSDDPAAVEALKGEGVCDFFDLDGTLRTDRIEALTGIIEAYETEQARVCAQFPPCRDDGGQPPDTWIEGPFLMEDGYGSIELQALLAELRWPVVAEVLGIESPDVSPSGAPAAS
jgi:hypothetical protein